ncbi:HAD family hydrolase [Kineosporia sp. J2-2]|uniref:HAD family hydrolase n=1 Tax=Kineosporia corallincola TaxID=2835133 RepID=A0ABS5TER6_9ACTN|nr:HAD family hydrolase [Kineosporia corallincola]MBT0769578.1 HAD family hydrolase [Kineosporia corallincola]
MADTAIFDVDGTLVDTNYQHALAWFRAFRQHDVTLPLWRLHRAIGMGGDKLVAAVAGAEVERTLGDEVRTAWEREFDTMVGEIRPFEGVRDLLGEVKDRGFRLVLASSGKAKHVEHFLDLFGGRDLADAWTTSEDAQESKPAPDLVQVAMEKVTGAHGVMVGDSTWDAIAAGRAGLPAVAVRTGGFSEQELREAGAVAVHDSLVDLREHLDGTPLGRVG